MPHPQRPPLQRYAEAYPIAVQLTSAAGSRGFHLGQRVRHGVVFDQVELLIFHIATAEHRDAKPFFGRGRRFHGDCFLFRAGRAGIERTVDG